MKMKNAALATKAKIKQVEVILYFISVYMYFILPQVMEMFLWF